MMKQFGYLVVGIVLLTSCKESRPDYIEEAEKQLPEIVDYNLHVRPILSDKCFHCHGPDKNNQKAGLRLDTREGALAELTESPGKFAIVPGKLHKSEVFQRIITEDESIVMPEAGSNLYLSDIEKATLVRWIEQGAEYKPHWAYIKPEKKELPEVKDNNWVKNEIDQFVLKKIEDAGFTPSEEADKETLIRRVSFDLVGLPPSINDIEKFTQDRSENAYEKLVDSLLASPAFGERLSSYWLDVARYSDTEGYLDDQYHRVWPYRDWVINAFNNNLPFDDFILWQIGGDQIPNAKQEQILATTFNRLNRTNTEGGIIPEEFRVEYTKDRTNTLGTAFLGLTLECAQCHDHKYDPISQKEYYQFYSFFNNVDETGVGAFANEDKIDPGPTLLLTDEKTDSLLAFVNNELNQKSKKVNHYKEKNEAFNKWKQQANVEQSIQQQIDKKTICYYDFDAYRQIDPKTYHYTNKKKGVSIKKGIVEGLKIQEGKSGKGLKVNADGSFTIPTDDSYLFERIDPFSISIWANPEKEHEDGTILYNSNHRVQAYRGYDITLVNDKLSWRLAHAYPYQSLQVVTKNKLPINKWSHITVTYDGSSKANGMKIYVDGKEQEVEIAKDRLYKSIVPKNGAPQYWIYTGLKIGYRLHEVSYNGLVDELKIFNELLTPAEVKYNYATTSHQFSDKELFQFHTYNINPEFQALKKEFQEAKEKEFEIIEPIHEIMVMNDIEDTRQAYILNRGVFDDYGDEVESTTPEWMLSFKDYPKNRYGLGLWLIDNEHPLTARVAVNRFWQLVFGSGLVKTSNDFGSQGKLPTHPELLDWLAVDFVESGWDVKAFFKKMVMSSTYRQSSKIRADVKEKDPENLLLASHPRYRLPAEMIRDNALKMSGLLVDSLGGPSVKPYQPEGLWAEVSNVAFNSVYDQSHGNDLYRRSVYSFWKRNVPLPNMILFDKPDRAVCTVQRQKTSTPLQALVLLNDPQYLEASRVMAENIIKETNNDEQEMLTVAFRKLSGRMPHDQEIKILSSLYSSQKEEFAADLSKAKAYLSTGEKEVSKDVPKDSLAALAVVCNTIMNSTEAYFKK